MADRKVPVNYTEYLQLNKILTSQELESAKTGKPAHDEMLFIIIHQAYELWFKQILHELDDILSMFRKNYVDEKNIGIANSRLYRIIEIQKILIDQIRILETMTPLDFLEFRDLLAPASGFQSFQFRLVEVRLGLKAEQRLAYNNKRYSDVFSKQQQNELFSAEKELCLHDAVEKWLERTPFLNYQGFDFCEFYRDAVYRMLDDQRKEIETNKELSEEARQVRLQMNQDEKKHFQSIFDRGIHEKLIRKGERRFSHEAMMAALFIHLYRDQPILHLPFRFLANLLDIDELFTSWRYRHSLMVLRMIGKRMGTGGSSGHDYLRTTAEKHKIFVDLFNLSTFLIPRSKLPELPADFRKNLGFFYSGKS